MPKRIYGIYESISTGYIINPTCGATDGIVAAGANTRRIIDARECSLFESPIAYGSYAGTNRYCSQFGA